MSLFPPVLEAISTRFRQRQARVYLYNATRPLLLSGRAGEIKKKSMYMHIPQRLCKC